SKRREPGDPVETRDGAECDQHCCRRRAERHRDPDRQAKTGTGGPDEECRPMELDYSSQGVTRSRSCSIRVGPIPGTASRSSTEAKGPCSMRKSTIFCAVTGPTPGSVSSSSTVADDRLTSGPVAPTTPAPADPGVCVGVATPARAGTTTWTP